ncbi:hypothetical protein PIB30_016199 [Stylosanthes scabra]|uniref:Uncharacterized protein n=1 Tax=Stylosanthes scabra TaxID=79078 RepID=A0ABU6V775_9FABA|nr:hypothetical protein [Stylosanthes scabra]
MDSAGATPLPNTSPILNNTTKAHNVIRIHIRRITINRDSTLDRRTPGQLWRQRAKIPLKIKDAVKLLGRRPNKSNNFFRQPRFRGIKDGIITVPPNPPKCGEEEKGGTLSAIEKPRNNIKLPLIKIQSTPYILGERTIPKAMEYIFTTRQATGTNTRSRKIAMKRKAGVGIAFCKHNHAKSLCFSEIFNRQSQSQLD